MPDETEPDTADTTAYQVRWKENPDVGRRRVLQIRPEQVHPTHTGPDADGGSRHLDPADESGYFPFLNEHGDVFTQRTPREALTAETDGFLLQLDDYACYTLEPLDHDHVPEFIETGGTGDRSVRVDNATPDDLRAMVRREEKAARWHQARARACEDLLAGTLRTVAATEVSDP